ncbi:MAG: EamA family transporter [Rikenellaceae bacterium]
MNYVLILIMTYLGAQGAVLLKSAASREDILSTIRSSKLYLGISLYACASIVNIYLLTVMEYSKVLPLTSLTYLWTMLLSHLALRERIGTLKLAGVALIILGALLVAIK